MKNIVDKQITLRKAAAMGLVFCALDTVDLIKNNLLSKGNAFEFARAAGFLGAKNTQHLLPHCHPVSIEAMDLTFDLLSPRRRNGRRPAAPDRHPPRPRPRPRPARPAASPEAPLSRPRRHIAGR